jgi:hypothetical protein
MNPGTAAPKFHDGRGNLIGTIPASRVSSALLLFCYPERRGVECIAGVAPARDGGRRTKPAHRILFVVCNQARCRGLGEFRCVRSREALTMAPLTSTSPGAWAGLVTQNKASGLCDGLDEHQQRRGRRGTAAPPDGAEVGRGQDRDAVATGDRGRCSVGRSSSERRGDAATSCLLRLSAAPLSKRSSRHDSTTGLGGAAVSPSDAALLLPPRSSRRVLANETPPLPLKRPPDAWPFTLPMSDKRSDAA